MSETVVLYFFQSEPGESMETPNALMLPPLREPLTFGKFLQHFQAVNYSHSLHFRFKKEEKTHGYVWVDIKLPTDVVPLYKGMITAKVLKLDDLICSKRRTRLRIKPNADKGVTAAQQMSRSRQMQNAPVEQDDQDDEIPDDFQSAQPVPNSGRGFTAEDIGISFDDDVGPPKAPTRSQIQPPVQDMFHFDEPDTKLSSHGAPVGSSSPRTPSSAEGTPTATSAAATSVGTGGLSREELKDRRETMIQEKVKEALEFKQGLDETARKESEEGDAAREKHDRALTTWATNNKEKRNVRTLLSTMHTVLWSGNTWKPIGLGDVIDAGKVKLQYRKAMLVVHPDRCSGLSAEIRFIAKRVFEAINEAYQEFLKKESV